MKSQSPVRNRVGEKKQELERGVKGG